MGKVLVADHCISRSHASTFFDERNLTLVCNGINWGKFKGNKFLIGEIEAVVDKKWGEGTVDELRNQARLTKKYGISELETLTKTFDEMYREK